METILAKLSSSSDNPEVLLIALLEAKELSKKIKEENGLHIEIAPFYKEIEKRLENPRFFKAFSKAVIMHYIMTNI